MIIGLTGTLGAGKSEVAKYAAQNGIFHLSVRSFLEEECKRRGIEPNRDNLVKVANEIRTREGSAYLVKELCKNCYENKIYIIESIRCPGEVEETKQRGGLIFAIDAYPEIRYDRIITRKSLTDRVSFEKFLEDEKREMHSTDPNEQNLSFCMENADYLILNNGTLEDLHEEVKKSVLSIDNNGKMKRRPSFEEMFMRQAFEWSLRSTCLRRQVGAVIVKNNTLISQGYNGPPRGVKHCEERGGCLRQLLNIPSGQQLEKCYAKHAEANAILNAGRTGRSVVEAKLFCTHYPCSFCTGDIIQAGINEVIYLWGYDSGGMAKQQFDEVGVKVVRFSGATPMGFVKFWN
ncbi:MAG: deaminase [Candidatus Pacearchaeota archaeon]